MQVNHTPDYNLAKELEAAFAPSDSVTLVNSATFNDLEAAIQDAAVKSVSLHKPGEVITQAGKQYVVDSAGTWRRLTPKPGGKRRRKGR